MGKVEVGSVLAIYSTITCRTFFSWDMNGRGFFNLKQRKFSVPYPRPKSETSTIHTRLFGIFFFISFSWRIHSLFRFSCLEIFVYKPKINMGKVNTKAPKIYSFLKGLFSLGVKVSCIEPCLAPKRREKVWDSFIVFLLAISNRVVCV